MNNNNNNNNNHYNYIKYNKCDKCNRECEKTPYGSAVIITKLEIRICMKCYAYRNKLIALNRKYGLLNYLRKREIGSIFLLPN
tara:strand:- start:1488 stop:1736 length:249 start_codon:yes stop_codon:yes gene_type:complete